MVVVVVVPAGGSWGCEAWGRGTGEGEREVQTSPKVVDEERVAEERLRESESYDFGWERTVVGCDFEIDWQEKRSL